jgi:hypothetical protein
VVVDHTGTGYSSHQLNSFGFKPCQYRIVDPVDVVIAQERDRVALDRLRVVFVGGFASACPCQLLQAPNSQASNALGAFIHHRHAMPLFKPNLRHLFSGTLSCISQFDAFG